MIALVVVCSVLAALVPDQADGVFSYYDRQRQYRDDERIWKAYRFGNLEYGDRQLSEKRINTPSDIDRRYCPNPNSLTNNQIGQSTVNLDLPEYGQNSYGVIHYIEVFHLTTPRGGWRVWVTRGGIGQNYVSLRMDSDNKCEQDYLVRVYGR